MAVFHAEPDVSDQLLLMADDPTAPKARQVRRRFRQIIDALEKMGARYALCGATAMGAHGVRRFTEDLDFLVDARDFDRLLAVLPPSLRQIRHNSDEVRLRARGAKSAAGVDVDLMVPVDAEEAWALASSVRARAFGRKVDVLSPEALVVLKLRAYLSDPTSTSGQQHRVDAGRLLDQATIDLPALRRFVASDPALAAELERALAAPPPKPRRR